MAAQPAEFCGVPTSLCGALGRACMQRAVRSAFISSYSSAQRGYIQAVRRDRKTRRRAAPVDRGPVGALLLRAEHVRSAAPPRRAGYVRLLSRAAVCVTSQHAPPPARRADGETTSHLSVSLPLLAEPPSLVWLARDGRAMSYN